MACVCRYRLGEMHSDVSSVTGWHYDIEEERSRRRTKVPFEGVGGQRQERVELR